MAAAVFARRELGLGTSSFPPKKPARHFLESIIDYEPNTRKKEWFCQVFLPEGRYAGTLPEDICFYRYIQEVIEHMTGKKMMQIRISADLHKWLKLHAARNDTTMTDIIVRYLEKLRQTNEKKVQIDQI
jgi:hypothetical protein